MTDTGPARQAGPDPRGSERSGPGRSRSPATRASARRCRPSAMRSSRARRCSCCRISGAPKRGSSTSRLSLQPVAARLSELLGKPVPLRQDWLDGVDCAPGSAVLCENVRFNKGEKKDKEDLARQMADAVRRVCHGCVRHGASRRGEHARRGAIRESRLRGTVAGGRARGARARAREACAAAGRDRRRLESLHEADGARVAAREGRQAHRRRRHCQHFPRGYRRRRSESRCTRRTCSMSRADSLEQARARGAEIPLPTDVVVAREFAATAHADVRSVHEVRSDEMILDIGPDTADRFGAMPGIGRDHHLERPGGRVRVRAVWRGHHVRSPRRSRAARRFPWPAAATPWRPSRNTASRTASPISRPAAARFWSSSKGRPCRRSSR